MPKTQSCIILDQLALKKRYEQNMNVGENAGKDPWEDSHHLPRSKVLGAASGRSLNDDGEGRDTGSGSNVKGNKRIPHLELSCRSTTEHLTMASKGAENAAANSRSNDPRSCDLKNRYRFSTSRRSENELQNRHRPSCLRLCEW